MPQLPGGRKRSIGFCRCAQRVAGGCRVGCAMASSAAMNRERLSKIRNWQSKDWYAAVFMRPLTILVMLVIADWKWLTPNMLTTAANLSKLAAALLIFTADRDLMIIGAVVLQAGLLFDHLDGTVARYRGIGSCFGSVYDKLSDGLTWFVIVMVIGWVAYNQSGKPLMLVLAAVSTYSLLAMGYSKWVIHAEKERLEWRAAQEDPQAAVASKNSAVAPTPPPERTFGQWLRWFGWSMLQIVRFEEVDLFFWAGLFIVIDRLDILLWLLAITQGVGIIGTVGYRLWLAHRIDVES